MGLLSLLRRRGLGLRLRGLRLRRRGGLSSLLRIGLRLRLRRRLRAPCGDLLPMVSAWTLHQTSFAENSNLAGPHVNPS